MHASKARSLLVLGASWVLSACGASEPVAASREVEVPSPPRAEPIAPVPRGPVAGAGRWMTDEAAARTLAKNERLPLLVDFRAAWCAACVELEKRTYPDPAVAKELERFVLLRVDVTDDADPVGKRLVERYGIEALPTLLMFDSTGHEVKRVTDFVPPEKLAPVLAPIR